ncbi:MAG: hypothetical protein J5822_06080 [Eubacteriaceae bacterium]|nr:hypothetical protein [Eubacteriaceae bacterium]
MGFTVYLIMLYLLLTAASVFAFVRNRKSIGIITPEVTVPGTAIIAYLWITSPMQQSEVRHMERTQ